MSAVIRQFVLRKRIAQAQADVDQARFAQWMAAARGETGPAPAHEWKGTKLRFQNPDGSWGEWVDLRGAPGKKGEKGESGDPGRVIVRAGIAGPQATSEEQVVVVAKRTDFVSDSLFYRGEALPGALPSDQAWRIARVTIGADGDVTEQWAEGNANFDKAWDDRAGLSYP